MLKTMSQAQEAYYMANGKYATSADELDITIPNSNLFNYYVSDAAVYTTRKNLGYLITVRDDFGTMGDRSRYSKWACGTETDVNYAKKICQSLGADINQNETSASALRWKLER